MIRLATSVLCVGVLLGGCAAKPSTPEYRYKLVSVPAFPPDKLNQSANSMARDGNWELFEVTSVVHQNDLTIMWLVYRKPL
jgi:hypothetical protein